MTERRQERRVLGRYLLADPIASGGMATIHLGRLLGPVGFARTVAIKRLHPQFAKDPEFVASFLDEARLAAKIQHPNVGGTLDVVAIEGELFLVMEYVDGESLSHLIRRAKKHGALIPPRVVSTIVSGVLYGLHAAHDAHGDHDEPLKLVHRDVSPQNILVGVDGVARVVDFGIAKAAQRVQETEVGRIKGKFGYMSPEQVSNRGLDRRSDVFSAGAVLWEALTSARLFEDEDPFKIMTRVLEQPIVPPSRLVPDLSPSVDHVVLRALERNRDQRFQSAREMAMALEQALPPALGREVGEWVRERVGDVLDRRARALSRLQREGSEPSPVATLKELARVLDSTDDTVDYPQPGANPAPSEIPTVTHDTDHDTTTTALMSPGEEVSVQSWNSETGRAPPRTTYLMIGIGVAAVLFSGAVIGATVLRATSNPDPKPPIIKRMPRVKLPPIPPMPTQDAGISAPSDAGPPVDAGRSRDAGHIVGPNCHPPYWVDSDGIKHYKPECNLGP